MDTKSKSAKVVLPPTAAHLVVVDDDPLFIRLISNVAGKFGIRLTAISSPAEAYRTLPRLQYDAALLDYDLGRVTGLQLSRFMDHTKPDVPVFLVSHCEFSELLNQPKSVVGKLPKQSGIEAILKEVLKKVKFNKGV